MEELEKLKLNAQEGRIDANRLLDLIASLQADLQAAQAALQAAKQRIADLETQLGTPSSKLDQPFSTRAEEQRQQKRAKSKAKKPKSKKRKGRVTSADKINRALAF